MKKRLIRNMLADNNPSINCASCGYPLQGKYCSQCGEKVLNEKDKKVSHFFEEFIHVLTHADSKFLKSLKYMFTKPGFLTKEYITGRRKLYTSPISLFFIFNLLYFLVPTVDALNTRYISQIQGQRYSHTIVAKAEQKRITKGYTPAQMAEHYDKTSSKISKLLLILLVFMFSVPVMLLFYNSKWYYYDHLIYATEFINFLIFGMFLLLPFLLGLLWLLVTKVFQVQVDVDINSAGSVLFGLTLLTTHLTMSATRVYQQHWVSVLLKSVVLSVSFVAAMILYRFILFHVTMWVM